MAQLSLADLKDGPALYKSPRAIGDVILGEDTAQQLLESSSSGNDTTLRTLLSQPSWTKTMLEEPHTIYGDMGPRQDPDDVREVLAMPISNLERALTVACQNGQAAVVPTLLAFATQQGIELSDVMTRSVISKTILNGHAAVFKALASADPSIVNFPLGHGILPLYEAARLKQTDIVAVLLELGADPLHPVEQSKKLYNHNTLMSRAAMAEGPRMTEILLKYGTPIAHTAALHTAASSGRLDTMRLLMQHGADINEAIPGWTNWTPMHFAASQGRVEAMELLADSGARADLKDDDGKTAAQLLEGHNATKQ